MEFKNKIDLHTHSLFSNHAISSISENIDYSLELGLEYLGLSDHQPDKDGKGASQDNFLGLKVVPRTYKGLRILRGCELNCGPNFKETFKKYIYFKYLDYCIASFHLYDYKSESEEKNNEYYLEAINQPFVKILGHIDDGRFPCDYRRIIFEAKEKMVAIEINNSSLTGINPRTKSIENVTEIIKICKELNCPVILNSDGHCKYEIGDVDIAYKMCKELKLDDSLVLNTNLDLFKKYFNI